MYVACTYVCMYVCMYECIDSSARRPNHTLYTDETTSLSTLHWGMCAPVVILEQRSKTVFLLDTSPNQTHVLSTGAVVDFSSVAPVSKRRPRCERSLNKIATFGNDPAIVSKNLAQEAWPGQAETH